MSFARFLSKIAQLLNSSGQVKASGLESGAAVSNIGYTPANKAGDTITGTLNIDAGGSTVLDVKNGGDIVYRNSGNTAAVTMYCDADNRLTVGDATGNGSILSRNNAKAWVSFGGGDRGRTAGTIYSAFNVSSITQTATGWYRANFTTALNSSIYPAVMCADDIAGVGFTINATGPDYAGMSSTFCYALTRATNNVASNGPVICLICYGT